MLFNSLQFALFLPAVVVRHTANQGLASAFRTGVDACLRLGADIIVNTDADNQYAGGDIPKLIQPILAGEADIVVGNRQTGTIAHFSATKRRLQRLGSFAVNKLSDTDIPDAVSGFRAVSRDAAMRINIVSDFSYTIEMLIQAGKKRMAVTSVPIRVNEQTRESRLFNSIVEFVGRSVATMLRAYTMYRPLRFFFSIGLVILVVGTAPIARFLYFYIQGEGDGHLQSLVLGSVLFTAGFITLLIGILAEVISFNRRLLEFLLEKVRGLEGPGRGNAP